MKIPFRFMIGPALVIGISAGCETSEPGGGLTTAATGLIRREACHATDLPAPTPPNQGEILGEVGDRSTNAGTAGRGADGAPVPPPGERAPVLRRFLNDRRPISGGSLGSSRS